MIKKKKVIKDGYVFTRIYDPEVPHIHICRRGCIEDDSGTCLLSGFIFRFCNKIAPISYKGKFMYIIKKEVET